MDLLRRHGQNKDLRDAREALVPLQRAIGKTLENISLPSHIAGRIEGRSSLARYGLGVHISAPTVMAGFRGRLYLEMFNYGPFEIELAAGMNIAQLVLEHVGLPPSQRYRGRYDEQH